LSARDSDSHKRRERAQAIGLFRYQLICPALDSEFSRKARGWGWTGQTPGGRTVSSGLMDMSSPGRRTADLRIDGQTGLRHA
jgi:hypothetical protein